MSNPFVSYKYFSAAVVISNLILLMLFSPPASAVSACGGTGERACCIHELLDNNNPLGRSCHGNLLTGLDNLVEVAGNVPAPALCGGTNLFGIQSNGRCEACGTEGAPKCIGVYEDLSTGVAQYLPINKDNECLSGLSVDFFGICSSCGGEGQIFCRASIEDFMCNAGYHPDGGFCTKDRVIEEPDCDCEAPFQVKNATEPVRGYADLHLHMFSNLAFGGMTIWGEAYNEKGGISQALRADNYAQRAGDIILNGHVTQGINHEEVPIDLFRRQQLVHGDDHINDIIGAGTGQGGIGFIGSLANPGVVWNENDTAATDFLGWPKWNSTTHQQSYYKWLERAHRGGLQLTVMLAVDNESMCIAGRHLDYKDFECATSKGAIDMQLAKARQFEEWLGNQCLTGADPDACVPGDSNEGWFKIVTSPIQAREAIAKGQLAVVLGIEEGNLFDCNEGNCDAQEVEDQLEEYRLEGVRHIFPIHNFDNDYGGTATWMDTIAVGNKYAVGEYYETVDCQETSSLDGDAGYGKKLGDEDGRLEVTDWLAQVIFGVPGDEVYPLDYANRESSCNKLGIRPGLGSTFISQLMSKGMIIDIDHMSVKAFEDTLTAAEAWSNGDTTSYPGIVASHALMFDLTQKDYRHERMRTKAQLERIAALGGMIGAMTQPPEDGGSTDKDTTHQWSESQVNNDCKGSSETWAQMYEWAVHVMQKPVAFGSDFNGISRHNAPRFGGDACEGRVFRTPQNEATRMTYPFTVDGFGTFGTQETGGRKFDYNTDGLAHIGMLPDMIEDLKMVGLTDEDLEPLFQSAEAYIVMWEGSNVAAGLDKDTGLTAQELADLNETTPPVVRAPADVTFESWEKFKESGLGTGTAIDNVDGVLTPTHNLGFNEVLPEGRYTITWTARDAAGNEGVDIQILQLGFLPNEFVIPADISVEATGPITTYTVDFAAASVKVNAGGTPFFGQILPFPTALNRPVGDYTIVWRATSFPTLALVHTATQNVSIVDTTGPSVTPPADITVEATGTTTAVSLGSGTANDLVEGDRPIVASFTGPFTVGTHTITWSASDSAGNIGTNTQTVVITARPDLTPPIILPPADITIEATGLFTNVSTGIAAAIDPEDGQLTATANINSPFAVGTHTVTWSATDTAGNTGTGTQIINVVDTTAPEVTAPSNIIVEATGISTSTDIGSALTVDIVDGIINAKASSLGPFFLGTELVIWNATDAAGNIGTASQEVTIVDTTPPVFPLLDVLANVEASGVLTDIILVNILATDLVDGEIPAIVLTTGPFPVGVHEIVIQATDTSGNSATTTQEITVVDTSPPVISIPGEINIEAAGVMTVVDHGLTSASDLVDGSVPMTVDNTGPYPLGVTVVTWIAVDAEGNTATASQRITVSDNTGPLVIGPADIIIEATAELTPVPFGLTSASDLVDGILVPVADPAGPFALGDHTVVWSATDSAQNVGNTVQIVSVIDTTAPALTLPADITVEATGITSAVTTDEATATDIFIVSITSDAPGVYPLGTTEVIWTATDINGNHSEGIQFVTVVDTTLPIVSAPDDIEVLATGLLTDVVLGAAAVTDTVSIVDIPTADPAGPFNVGETFVTWSVSDSSGNIGSAIQRVNVLGELACKMNFKEKHLDNENTKRSTALSLESFNLDENQVAIWSSLFGVDADRRDKEINLQQMQTVTWQAGIARLSGSMEVKVKRLNKKQRGDGIYDRVIKINGILDAGQSVTLDSATGAMKPTLASGITQIVKIEDIEGVSLKIDGQSVTGLAQLIKIKVDKDNPASVEKFSLRLRVQSSTTSLVSGSVNLIELNVPKTSITVLGDSLFKNTRRNKKGKSLRAALVNLEGIDPASLQDGHNADLRVRKGTCVVDIGF